MYQSLKTLLLFALFVFGGWLGGSPPYKLEPAVLAVHGPPAPPSGFLQKRNEKKKSS